MRVRTSNRKIIVKPWQDRLWSKIRMSMGCWIYSGSKNALGYGTISISNACQLAHRMAWISVNGQIPPGMCVCHTCDNPSCCRPDHLFLGSNADNVFDRHTKGRSKGGEYSGPLHSSKPGHLEKCKEIRSRYSVDNIEVLAREYNVSTDIIHSIGTRRVR